MDREPKWHIFGADRMPLCWEDKALEFNTYKDAKDFLISAIKESSCSNDFWKDIEIIEGVLYYDGGYLDATGYVVQWGKGEEEKLVKKSP